MPFIDQGLTLLLQAADLGAGIYGDIAPNSAEVPFIVFQNVLKNPWAQTITDSMTECREIIQVDAYSDSRKKMLELSDKIIKVLEGYSGDIDVDTEKLFVHYISFDSSRTFEEDMQDPKLYRNSMDFICVYKRD